MYWEDADIQPVPIFTAVVVVIVAGALYYRHKE